MQILILERVLTKQTSKVWAVKPLSRFSSANQHFCWAHADSFLDFPLYTIAKSRNFWVQADSQKHKKEHWVWVATSRLPNNPEGSLYYLPSCYCTFCSLIRPIWSYGWYNTQTLKKCLHEKVVLMKLHLIKKYILSCPF